MFFNSNKGKTVNVKDKLKVYQAKNTLKNQFLGKNTRQDSQNKYFKISLIYFEMASTQNLFGFEEIEADSVVDTTPIFEDINKELEEYLLEKKYRHRFNRRCF